MNPFRQYTAQSVLVVLQSALIIGGSLTTASLMKLRGYPDPRQFWHPLTLFVREWGFLLILIPGLWVCWTIWCEHQREYSFSKRSTIGTGLLLLALLAFFFFMSFMLACGVSKSI